MLSKKEHRAHCSIDILGIGSALYKTPLKRRFGTLGVKQADSSHIPSGCYSPLDFLRSATPRLRKLRRFACKPELKDDTLSLEALWLPVTSEQPSPLGWLARNRAVAAMQYGIFPRASKFCFLKLPCVFGYEVPFTAISKKQNRKGSPTSLIYPLKGKFTSFVIKQFFAFGKVHQTLMRSRLSALFDAQRYALRLQKVRRARR